MTRPARPPDGFEDAFPGLARVAHRVGYRILGSTAEAEDVAQEALARALVRWGRVERYAEAWVARVAANLALDQARRRKVPPHEGAPSDAEDGRVLDRLELVALLRQLPRRQREVVVLRFLADLPERAVAERLGCSVGTVKQHTHRALANLRRPLGASDV